MDGTSTGTAGDAIDRLREHVARALPVAEDTPGAVGPRLVLRALAAALAPVSDPDRARARAAYDALADALDAARGW